MKRKVRVAQYGLGAIGKIAARYSLAKGAELVAAFARSAAQVGKDAGEILEIGPVGTVVSHSDDLEKVLRETKPDIVVFSTKSSLWDIRDAALVCLRNKVNVLDIGENALWPWTDEGEVAAELDAAAKENGVTISASGCPDVCWGTLITTFAASCNKLTKIRCDSFLNLESYNADYMFEYHGVGLSVAEFEERFGSEVITEKDGHYPCLPGDQNAWLCSRLGLTVTKQTMQYIPIVRETDFDSKSFGRVIKAGELEGLGQLCRTETAEGIVIELMMGGKTDVTGVDEHTVWTLEGDPTSTLVWDNPDTYGLTCANAVNRIPQVLNAEPGYRTTDRFPVSRYLVKPMNEYVDGE